MKKLFSFFAILSLLLTSCEGFDFGGAAGKLEDLFALADVEKLDGFAAEGGRVTLSFTSEYDWTASSNRQWIEVDPESGLAGEEVNLRVALAENTTGKERTGKVFVELSNNQSYEIPVRQLANGGVQEETPVVELVDGGYYSINSNGGSLEVKVRTNTEYEVSISASWLEHTDTRAMRNETIVFTAQKNEGNSSREAMVSLYYGDGESVKFMIYQEAAPQGGDVEEPVLELVDGANYSINPNGGDIDIQVLSNMAYSVEIEASWLHENRTRTATTSVVSLYAEKNDTGAARSTVVVLRGEDNASVSFTVSQEPAQEDVVDANISVSPKNISLGADGGQQQVTVTSNAEWSVSCTESGISVSPLSGNGNGVVTITVPATSKSRTFSVDFEASNATSTAKASVVVSQSASGNEGGMTPGEHQTYLEQTGHRLLAYFNPEDSRTLAESVTELANAGGFDFYLESPTRNAGSAHSVQYAKKLAAAVSGMTRYSPMSAVKLSTSLVLPWEEGTYCLDDYKGKQYDFNFETGKWRESSLGDVNKMVANWGNSTATLLWVEGTSSWEGFIEYGETAKVENIPSSIVLEIAVNNNVELSAVVEIELPTNYSIDTKTAVSLNGGYNFSVVAKADRKGVEGSVIVSKGTEKLVTGGGKVLINDLTDSKNWWYQYTDEWYDGYEWHKETYSDFDFEYPVNQVKTGEAHATILDIGLSVQGDLRSIIDEGKKIENTESYDGAMLLSNYINSYALAKLYYTGNNEKIADVKAEPVADEYWDWDYNTNQEVLKTYYTPMPILVFTDGSKFAVDQYFTEVAFGNLIDAAEELMNKYIELVD